MSTPSWWDDVILEPGDGSISIADVETGGVGIITKSRLELVTNGNWTEPSADLFKSPLTGSGVFFDILMTRIDADTLEFRVRNYLGVTLITRRLDIEAAGNTTVEFYWGNSYLWIVARRATHEGFFAFLLDPEAVGGVDSDQPNRIVANAQRTTGGVATAIITGTAFAFDNGAAASGSRVRVLYYTTTGTQVYVGPAGRELYYPMYLSIQFSSVQVYMGAIPGAAFGPHATATDTVKNIPVDTGTKKAFVCLPFATVSTYTGRVMVRKPSVDP